MAGPSPDGHLPALQTIERVASCFSLAGTLFIFVTFASSSEFRKPINRLIFYASWGNTLCNIATMISQSGIRAQQHSHLCQFQGFLIQMFVPADAFWNLAMAINVYLTLFKKYNAQQLKAMEWRYHLGCYGIPFVVALTLVFVETQSKGKVYGDAVLWCWISKPWDYLRLVVCYAPAWFCILASFTIYVVAGRELFKKRQQLLAFNTPANLNPFDSYRTTDVQVTSELATVETITEVMGGRNTSQRSNASGNKYDQYTVNIMSSPMTPRPSAPHTSMVSMQNRKKKAAMEANRAAWGYTKVAILFFVSLLVTWLPSSINRVYALTRPGQVPDSYEYAAGVVLSLMGFWNSVIYITTSRAACKSLIRKIFLGAPEVEEIDRKRISADRSTLQREQSESEGTLNDSTVALATKGAVV